MIIDWKNEQVDSSLYAEKYEGMMRGRDLNSIYVSTDGTYWLGNSQGVFYFNPQKQPFKLFWLSKISGSENETITSLVPLDTTVVWVSITGGLIHFDLKARKETYYPLSVDGHEAGIVCLFTRNESELWIATHSGLWVFNHRQKKFYQPDFTKSFPVLRNNRIQFVFTDSKNNLWIGTRSSGLFLQRSDGNWKWFQNDPGKKSSLASNGLLSIMETHNGDIWIGLNGGGGLAKYISATDDFISFQNNPADTTSLSNGAVNALFEDNSGAIWAGTYGGGLNRFDPVNQTFKVFYEYDGLANNFVFRITGDESGKLWISTPQGVSVLNPADYKFTSFPADLRFASTVTEQSGVKDEAGSIYFFTQHSFIKVDPHKFFESYLPAKVVLTSVNVFDQPIPLAHDEMPLRLSYKQNFFSFEFAALDFIDPEKIQYEYMLEGFEQNWNHSGNRSYTAYTNVPPGEYVFKVRATRESQTANSPITSLAIGITPPFWKTNWFRAASIICFIALVFAVIQFRERLIRKEERRKASFQKKVQEVEMKALRAQMNPHFIFNCMNSIQRYIYKNDQSSAIELLQNFAMLIRKILDNSEKKFIPLSEDLALLRDYLLLEQLRTENLFDFKLEVSDEVNAEMIEVPSMLLQPFAENAIWHGLMPSKRRGLLRIQIGKSDGTLHCVIEDNGVGRNHSGNEQNKISQRPKGLMITQERMRLMAEQLNRESEVRLIDLKDENENPNGTRVELEIPIR